MLGLGLPVLWPGRGWGVRSDVVSLLMTYFQR